MRSFLIIASLFFSANVFAQEPNPAQPLGPCVFSLSKPPGCDTDPLCHEGWNRHREEFISPTVSGLCGIGEGSPAIVLDQFGGLVTAEVVGVGEVAVIAPENHFYFYDWSAGGSAYYGGVVLSGSDVYPRPVANGVMRYLGRFIRTGRCRDQIIESGGTRNHELWYDTSMCRN